MNKLIFIKKIDDVEEEDFDDIKYSTFYVCILITIVCWRDDTLWFFKLWQLL